MPAHDLGPVPGPSQARLSCCRPHLLCPFFASTVRLSRLEGRQTALLSDLSTRVAGTECNLVNC